jgi:ABC-2 type transport system ATP-binding protein
MAMVGEPRVMYLDEPTLGLDVLARRELWNVLRALKGHVTVVLTTHYLEEAEALADRIGVMAQGRLLALDTPDALKAMTGAETFEDAFIKIVEGGKRS